MKESRKIRLLRRNHLTKLLWMTESLDQIEKTLIIEEESAL